jgi:hypothetical protein
MRRSESKLIGCQGNIVGPVAEGAGKSTSGGTDSGIQLVAVQEALKFGPVIAHIRYVEQVFSASSCRTLTK